MQYGMIRTTWLNQRILLAAWLGADLAHLQQVYRQGAVRHENR